MPEDHERAGDLISGSSKRSPSYHSDYAKLTYGEIKRLADEKPQDAKARQMKKLIEQRTRLADKQHGKPKR